MAATAPVRANLTDSATAAVRQRIEGSNALRPNSDAEIRALISAALDTVMEIGSLDPSVRDILRRSGLSRQVFYHYFSSKDELLLIMVAAGWRLVAEYIDERVASASSHTDKLTAWIASVMRQAQSASIRSLTKPFTFTGHRLEQRYPAEYADARRTLTRSLATIIDDGVSAGVFMTDQSAADALVIYDAVFARQNRYIVLDQLSSADDVEALSEFSLRALCVLAG